MQTLTEENYLKAIFKQSQNPLQKITPTTIAEEIEINAASVISMLKKLSDKKWITYDKINGAKLTLSGNKLALSIVRKHRLTEMYLVEKMGFGWEDVHEIAEQIEHIQSTEFFEKMDELLGHPKLDPHGSPIPDKNGKMVWKEYIKLSECKAGDFLKLVAVNNNSNEFLKFLTARELSLGLKVKIKSIESFDKTMVISYGKHQSETFSHTVCERLLVEKL